MNVMNFKYKFTVVFIFFTTDVYASPLGACDFSTAENIIVITIKNNPFGGKVKNSAGTVSPKCKRNLAATNPNKLLPDRSASKDVTRSDDNLAHYRIRYRRLM